MASNAMERANSERRFYSGMAIFMIVVVLIGFAPSFYLRGLVHYPRPNPTLNPLVILHGMMFSAWMILFIIQVRFVAGGRRDLHMKLGQWGFVLAIALVPLMIVTALGGVARESNPPFTTPLAWTAVPLWGVPAYIAVAAAGWKYRRNAQAHKRLMLGLGLMLLGPAIGRFPIFPPTLDAFYVSSFVAWLPMTALFVWDWRTGGRFHWATQYAGGVMAVMLIVRCAALTSPLWLDFAGGMVKLARV